MDRLDIDKNRAKELGGTYVNSYWKSLAEDDVGLAILSGGYSSRLYIVEDNSTSSSNPIKKFLIRLYGGKMVTENNPVKSGGEIKESLVFYAVGMAGLGPKLYGAFDGGRVEEFVPSHMLREPDYNDRPETVIELSKKLARYHALKLPISKDRHHILDSVELLYQKSDMVEFKKLADHTGYAHTDLFTNFDVRSESKWLKGLEEAVGGRLVTICGDVNKNNILVRDEPDTFGERVMMIDYEMTAIDYRGRDIGQISMMRVFEIANGIFTKCCDYPDENWRRLVVTEYLKETKKLNYFEWDEELDSVEHVLMEADFFVFHSILMFYGFISDPDIYKTFYLMTKEQARSMLDIMTYLIGNYQQKKDTFIETYGKKLKLP